MVDFSNAPLLAWTRQAAAIVDDQPQGIVAVTALLVGALLASRGFVLMRPLFVISGSFWIGVQVFFMCRKFDSSKAAHWAPLIASCVAVPTAKLWNHMYKGFAFICGCALGGCAMFLYLTLLAGEENASALIGATVLVALLVGLSFMKFHDVYWSLLTPWMGGLLLATGIRYYAFAMLSADALWTRFVEDIRKVDTSVGFDRHTAIPILFWAAWAIVTVMGWYLQISYLLFKSRQPEPEWSFSELLTISGLASRLAPDALRSSARRLPQVPEGRHNEPLLSATESAECKMHDADVQASEVPKVPVGGLYDMDEAVSKEVSDAFLFRADYRPEFALLVAAASVLFVNWLLRTKPLLFVGHAVLMSVAFLPLTTASLVSYASKGLLLPRLFGPQMKGESSRQLTQAAFDGLALACALGGLGCIWEHNRQTGTSQLGFNAQASLARMCHVWMGYLIILFLTVQATRGILRLYSVVTRSSTFAKTSSSHRLGRAIYCLSSLSQLIAYTFPGVFPEWASPVLAAMLIFIVCSTLFWLNERARMHTAARRLQAERARAAQESQLAAEFERARLLKDGTVDALSAQSSTTWQDSIPEQPAQLTTVYVHRTSSSSASSSKNTKTGAASTGSLKAIENLQSKLLWHSNMLLMRELFSAWQLFTKSNRLETTAAETEGQDRLVEFLSQALSREEIAFTTEDEIPKETASQIMSEPARKGTMVVS